MAGQTPKKPTAKHTCVGSLPPDAPVYSGGSTLYSPRRFSKSGPSTPPGTSEGTTGPTSPTASPPQSSQPSADSSSPPSRSVDPESLRPFPWEKKGGPKPGHVWNRLAAKEQSGEGLTPEEAVLMAEAFKATDAASLASLLM